MLTLDGVEDKHRLLVPAHVSTHPAAVAQGVKAASHDIRLLLDTGASHSVIDDGILRAIGESRGVQTVNSSVAGSNVRHVYRVLLTIDLVDPLGVPFPWSRPLSAIAAQPMTAVHQGVLGIDVLRDFRLLYDGPQKTYRLMTDAVP